MWWCRGYISHNTRPHGRITTRNVHFSSFLSRPYFIISHGSMVMSPGSSLRLHVPSPALKCHACHPLNMHQSSAPKAHYISCSFHRTTSRPCACVSPGSETRCRHHPRATTTTTIALPHKLPHRIHQSSGRTEFVACCPVGHCPFCRPLVPVAASSDAAAALVWSLWYVPVLLLPGCCSFGLLGRCSLAVPHSPEQRPHQVRSLLPRRPLPFS